MLKMVVFPLLLLLLYAINGQVTVEVSSFNAMSGEGFQR